MSIHNGRIKTTWRDDWKYGFIVDENDMDIRFHIDNSPDLSGKISSLTEGSPVEFEKKPSAKYPGKYEAHNVRLQADRHMKDNTQSLSPSSSLEDDTSQENALSKTCLILTVGTNALPVWVAWHHLKNLSEKLPSPIRVQLVHTEKTEDEMKRLRTKMEKYYSKHSSQGFVTHVQTSPGDPCKVFDNITKVLNDLQGETEHVHVHYTGGTQVMGVETVSAATKFDGLKHVSTSYLTVHADTGPAIMGRKLTDVGNLPMNLINDTRVKIVEKDVDLNFLRFIAQLNGFGIGEFTHLYKGNQYDCPAPRQFEGNYLSFSKKVLDAILCAELQTLCVEWGKGNTYNRKRNFTYPNNSGSFPVCSNSLWESTLLPFFAQDEYSRDLVWTANQICYPGSTKATDEQKKGLKQIHDFFTGTWLEYAAGAAFHNALQQIEKECKDKNGSENDSRSGYALFHSVYVRRTTTTDDVRVFELDVVAMLGHQIIVVSCTTIRPSTGYGQEQSGKLNLIKQKGVEVLHRARQLGGDEARAIVLCGAQEDDAQLLENELKDETGGASEPLQIWGLDKWSKLTQEFKDYCKKLRW